MRLNAYILAADPAFLTESVSAYYDLVETIVVSYDQNGRGWTGAPIPVETCLARLKELDRDRKMRFLPGDFARLDYSPMENETYQRQQALNAAAEGADWVLQLDTDEVALDPGELVRSVEAADAAGFRSLAYPSRQLYCEVAPGTYLECARRFARPAACFLGPVAVKGAVKLINARRSEAASYHVGHSSKPPQGGMMAGIPVNRVVKLEQSIIHYSWIRSEGELRRKFASWSHATDRDWEPEVQYWLWAQRHPQRAVVRSLVRPGPSWRRHLRLVSLPPGRPKAQ